MPSSATWLAAGLTSPFGLAVDDTNVYWTDVGDQTIRSVPRVGGPIAILAQNQAKPYGIAVDGANAYWSNNLGGAIMRAPKDGTGIVTIVAPATLPLDIAVDANFVYWLESDAIRKAPIAGGASTVVAAGGTSGFGGPLIFDGVSTLCTHLGGAVVCYDTSGNVVGGTAGSFGTYYPLAMDSSCICEWQIFATTLLCTSWKSPPPKCVGGWYQVVPTVQAIALNPCAVFWAESNAIWMAPRGGGQLSAGNLARVVPDVMTTHLVANAGWLFWSDVSAIGAVPIP